MTRERWLQVGLGALWLLDGALQMQPPLFTQHFVSAVLLPSAAGNPAFVAGPIRAVAGLLEPHVALFNGLAGAIQLVIGAALLAGRWLRVVLGASIAWVLGVWWLGEGLGGLLSGAASPLSGAPGAVLLYGLAALLAWPRLAWPRAASERERIGLLGARSARLLVAAPWLLGAGLLLQRANLAPGALSSELSAAGGGEPRWLAAPIGELAAASRAEGAPATVAIAVVMTLIAVGLTTGVAPRLVVGSAVALAAAIWVLGEGLGGLFTGSATDPNSGPLLVLLALALAGLGGRRARSARPAATGGSSLAIRGLA